MLRCIKGEPAIEEYYEMHTEADRLSSEMADSVMQSPAAKFLSPGRVVVVKSQSVSSFAFFSIYSCKSGEETRINIISFLASFPVHMFFLFFIFSPFILFERERLQ